ncbi:DNA repair protein XRCC1-like protein [Sarcoptes scabiei]|uniref:DNA repair protein XRCC1-like protein n=1 Tax=Sarcoptes scabiei TaxID=52283 RepID=A0A132AJ02_SARSC|nr:DNA repair protein XRCC1-like protein [Sarcoptes scabiei]
MKILDPSAIPLSSIHSFSSENPNHLACNIIQTKTDQEYTNSWRCSKWSNYCWIVIDLNRPFLIDSIRLVNDGSAFVEIFASKSSNYSDFKVLVPVISLQSPSNCRKQTKNIKEFNINAEKFTSTKNIPCRLLKFVCSQPYNTDITYGLSSIKLFGIEYREEKVDRNEMSESLDKKFKLLQEGKCPINLMNPFDISSCDKRIKNDRIGLKKRARIIEKNETENVLRNSPNKKIEEIDLKDDKNLEPKLVKTSSSSKRKIMKIEEKIKNDAEDDGDVSRNKKKSSFKKLMSNVVFMTIGYDKSSQTDLIEKATLMGARHKSKWNPLECTHIM